MHYYPRKLKIKFHAFKHVFSFKIKKIKFHAFIYAFFKNSKTKKNQVLCIHEYILEKKQNKIKITKRIHAFMHAFSFRKFTKFHAFINALFKKNKKSNFMHSNMHFHSNQKFIFNQSFMHS